MAGISRNHRPTSAEYAITTDAAPGQHAFFTFDATAGEQLGLGIRDLVKTNAGSSYMKAYVYRPDGSTWVSENCYVSNGGCEIDLNIGTTGTYAVILVSPPGSSEPNLTISFTATVSRDVVVTPAANTPTSVSMARDGQNGRVMFTASAGSATTIQINGIATTPAGRSLGLTVRRPDGTSQSSASSGSSHTFALTNLPATGIYTLFVDPQFGVQASLQVTLQ